MPAYRNVHRNGFIYRVGRFLAEPAYMDRIEVSRLRSMFLPEISFEGDIMLRKHKNFVRCQLKHYGVEFEEEGFSGDGSVLMKKVLKEGKCDQILSHILELQHEMHMEWLNIHTLAELSELPRFVMEKCFLSFGQPDLTKTTTVICIPYPRVYDFHPNQMIKAVGNVAGLHCKKALGPKTQTIYMGWDAAAVEKSAEEHAALEEKELQDEKNGRDTKRDKMHMDYLNTLQPKNQVDNSKAHNSPASPVGSYILDSEDLEKHYGHQATHLTLDINHGYAPGNFKAMFDFGVLEGWGIITINESASENPRSDLARENEAEGNESTNDNDDEDNDESVGMADETSHLGSKRNASPSPAKPPKKYKAGTVQSPKYEVSLEFCEPGYGSKSAYMDGNLEFTDGRFVSLVGKVDFPDLDQTVSFFSRKISDVSGTSECDWPDSSEEFDVDAALYYEEMDLESELSDSDMLPF